MILLMDEQALRDRCTKARYDILRRAKPKRFKSGPRKGQVRVPGIENLTFSSKQLWNQALAQVGTGATRCPYCLAIGRPANLITLENYVWDHHVPVAHGGSHDLDNLVAVCEDCNRLKGSLSYECFIGLMQGVERWPDAKDRAYIQACLRTHGQVIKGFSRPKEDPTQKSSPPAIDVPQTGLLALRDDNW